MNRLHLNLQVGRMIFNKVTLEKAFITIHCNDKLLVVEADEKRIAEFPMSLKGIYALEPFFNDLFHAGRLTGFTHLEFDGPAEGNLAGLKLELLLQLIYLCVVFYLYPRYSPKSPLKPEASIEDFEHHLNGIRNIPHFERLCHCQVLRNHAQGMPIVLVAPGPSIDFDLLRRLRDRALVLAVGRSMPRLRAEGIDPDFLYVQETTASGWQAIFGQDDGTVLNTALVFNPAGPVHEHLHRVKLAYRAWNYYPFEEDQLPHIEEIAASSSTGAYSLARLMGGNPIVLLGCDCGEFRTPDNPSPLDTIPAHDLEEIVRTGVVPTAPFRIFSKSLLNTGSGQVVMKADYVACAQWLKNRLFFSALNQGMEYFDSSVTGIIRTNGVAKPIPADLDFPVTGRRPFPIYVPNFDPSQYVKRLAGRYATFKRHFQRQGIIPNTALEAPYNCMFTDIKRYDGTSFELDAEETARVLARLDTLLEAVEPIRAGL